MVKEGAAPAPTATKPKAPRKPREKKTTQKSSNAPPPHPGMDYVNKWLDDLNLPEYKGIFEAEGYDRIESLAELTEADLQAIKVKRGHTSLIMRNLPKKVNLPLMMPPSMMGYGPSNASPMHPPPMNQGPGHRYGPPPKDYYPAPPGRYSPNGPPPHHYGPPPHHHQSLYRPGEPGRDGHYPSGPSPSHSKPDYHHPGPSYIPGMDGPPIERNNSYGGPPKNLSKGNMPPMRINSPSQKGKMMADSKRKSAPKKRPAKDELADPKRPPAPLEAQFSQGIAPRGSYAGGPSHLQTMGQRPSLSFTPNVRPRGNYPPLPPPANNEMDSGLPLQPLPRPAILEKMPKKGKAAADGKVSKATKAKLKTKVTASAAAAAAVAGESGAVPPVGTETAGKVKKPRKPTKKQLAAIAAAEAEAAAAASQATPSLSDLMNSTPYIPPAPGIISKTASTAGGVNIAPRPSMANNGVRPLAPRGSNALPPFVPVPGAPVGASPVAEKKAPVKRQPSKAAKKTTEKKTEKKTGEKKTAEKKPTAKALKEAAAAAAASSSAASTATTTITATTTTAATTTTTNTTTTTTTSSTDSTTSSVDKVEAPAKAADDTSIGDASEIKDEEAKPEEETKIEEEEKEVCAFCGVGDDEKLGELDGPYDEYWVHEDCACWTPEVYIDASSEEPMNLQKAINRGKNLKCSFCKKKGATIGCIEQGCKKNFHFACIEKAGGIMNEQDFKIRCSEHKDAKPKKTRVRAPSTTTKPKKEKEDVKDQPVPGRRKSLRSGQRQLRTR